MLSHFSVQPFPAKKDYDDFFGVPHEAIFGSLAGQNDKFAFLSRFMVAAAYRRTRMGGQSASSALLRQAYHDMLDAGTEVALLNCSPCLVPYYAGQGW
jgi:hypothetical protein